MDDFLLARVVHVLGVVLWIGGVAFVTTILLPGMKKVATPAERVIMFERMESDFAWQARLTTLLTGASGFYMLYILDAWERFSDPSYWWLHAMLAIWLIFTMMLFVLEPLVVHKLFERWSRANPEGTLAMIQRLHWVLLSTSLITVAGAVAGVHGG
ncbi:MAG: hypothetical protein CMM23_01645 [Rhodospirillaceae bacterium]|jgi:uncharacterized membrane protein|nr:hypothetical protein [Rhodospirillaceae bacterium]MDP7056157.1 hypothetical protein [Alphaproteobacteria bacterium]MDP7461090.1 hypothetical protein [Alphaproteobacteria bacterium]|tara:strand:+ start:494 stop:961 length:468 start_codon:yes stop_codon:yes gene_type:complete